MNTNFRGIKLVASSLLIAACDPSSMDTDNLTTGSANSSGSNTAFEILSVDNTAGSIRTASITSSQSSGNGLIDNPIVLNSGEPFQVFWETSVSDASLISLELYSPDNPDIGSSGFFSMANCNNGGDCVEYSVTCDYNTNPVTDTLSSMNCPFTHPDTGDDTLNYLDFSYINAVDTSAEQARYELRINLCSHADVLNCDVSRIAFIEINK